MKRLPPLLIRAAEAFIVLAAIYFEPTHCVRGTMHGEKFFRGRPTSYWASELERWDVAWHEQTLLIDPPKTRTLPYFTRQSNWFDRLRQRWSAPPEPDWGMEILVEPVLLRVDDDRAKSVLRELLGHPSPKVREMARIGLGLERDREAWKE